MRDDDILEVAPATTVAHMNMPFAKALAGEISWGKA
jgi:hypothetical protein